MSQQGENSAYMAKATQSVAFCMRYAFNGECDIERVYVENIAGAQRTCLISHVMFSRPSYCAKSSVSCVGNARMRGEFLPFDFKEMTAAMINGFCVGKAYMRYGI